MNSVLNRKMFNQGGAAATGLDAYKGKALTPKQMSMGGIMTYADGGPVYLAEGGDPIQQRQMQNVETMNQILESMPTNAREKMQAQMQEVDALRTEAARLKQQGGVPEAVINDMLDRADKIEFTASKYSGEYFDAMKDLDPANMVASNLQDMDAGFLGFGKPSAGEIASLRDENQAILDQLATFDDETSQKYLTDLEATNPDVKSQVAEAKKTADTLDKADNPYTALRPAADGKATGNAEEDAEGINKHLDKIAQESGRTDLSREDYSITNNPYGAIGLLLASKGMATAKTGSTVGDIVSGVSDAAVGMESLQRKDLELATDLEKERIAAKRSGTVGQDIQNFEYLGPEYMRMFPNADRQAIFDYVTSSRLEKPTALITAYTKTLTEGTDKLPTTVANNYAKIVTFDDLGKSLTGSDAPIVAYQKLGDKTFYLSKDDAEAAAAREIAASGNKKVTIPDMMESLGIKGISTIEELSRLNMPSKG